MTCLKEVSCPVSLATLVLAQEVAMLETVEVGSLCGLSSSFSLTGADLSTATVN